MLQVEG